MGTHPIFESDFDCLTEWGEVAKAPVAARAAAHLDQGRPLLMSFKSRQKDLQFRPSENQSFYIHLNNFYKIFQKIFLDPDRNRPENVVPNHQDPQVVKMRKTKKKVLPKTRVSLKILKIKKMISL